MTWPQRDKGSPWELVCPKISRIRALQSNFLFLVQIFLNFNAAGGAKNKELKKT